MIQLYPSTFSKLPSVTYIQKPTGNRLWQLYCLEEVFQKKLFVVGTRKGRSQSEEEKIGKKLLKIGYQGLWEWGGGGEGGRVWGAEFTLFQ